jgi:hypothetical protein
MCGAGCSDDDSAPPPAPSGGGKGDRPTTGGSGMVHRDAGGVVDDDDGGAITLDGGIVGSGAAHGECYDVEPAAYMSDTTLGEYNNAIRSPSDFVITRVLATWDPRCSPATIVIALSGGHCPNGDGHELRFYIDAQAIVDGIVVPGVNVLLPEPSLPTDDQPPIRARYFRPERLMPSGDWGSCTKAAGMLSIRDELDVRDLRTIQGAFELELTPCGSGASGTQTLIGTLNASMKRTLSVACPASP